jgi:hypothetical protein
MYQGAGAELAFQVRAGRAYMALFAMDAITALHHREDRAVIEKVKPET